jgi:hypothetical protein
MHQTRPSPYHTFLRGHGVVERGLANKRMNPCKIQTYNWVVLNFFRTTKLKVHNQLVLHVYISSS